MILLPCLALVLLGAGRPVERDVPGGTVDWTAKRIRVNGVGTPRIVSPTGALTERDLYEAAREDARARLERVLAAIPVDDARRLGEIEALAARRRRAVQGFMGGEARYFSDGTVHLPATVDFSWVVEALAGPSPAPARVPPPPAADAGAGEPPPTGLIVIAAGPTRPALRVRLESDDGERHVYAGLRTDPVGPAGVAWVASRRDARASPLAGERPLVVRARAPRGGGPGVLRLRRRDARRLFGDEPPAIGGGVVVVTR